MPLRTAVVGAGTVSGTHLSGIDENPATELVGVCDVDERLADDAAARYGVEAFYDVDELLGERSLDWLHVCTPVQTHLEISKKAIAAGVPLLIEKPVTMTVEELETLARLAEEHDVPVSPVHQHLFDPAMVTARRMIRSGELGRIKGVDLVFTGHTKPDDVNRGSWVFDLPGGEFEEGLPHPIYLSLGLGGYPRSESDVSVTTALIDDYDRGFEYDAVQVQYVTDDDALCSMKMISGGQPRRLIHVHGEERSITIDILLQMVHTADFESRDPVTLTKHALDEAASRVTGLARNAGLMAKSTLTDDWEAEKARVPHYQQFDRTAKALESGSPMPVPLSSSEWTIQIMHDIRAAATGERSEPADRTLEAR